LGSLGSGSGHHASTMSKMHRLGELARLSDNIGHLVKPPANQSQYAAMQPRRSTLIVSIPPSVFVQTQQESRLQTLCTRPTSFVFPRSHRIASHRSELSPLSPLRWCRPRASAMAEFTEIGRLGASSSGARARPHRHPVTEPHSVRTQVHES
jgi:hypothetical protein